MMSIRFSIKRDNNGNKIFIQLSHPKAIRIEVLKLPLLFRPKHISIIHWTIILKTNPSTSIMILDIKIFHNQYKIRSTV
jgi:hypothetical protein